MRVRVCVVAVGVSLEKTIERKRLVHASTQMLNFLFFFFCHAWLIISVGRCRAVLHEK